MESPIKTFEDACQLLGLDAAAEVPFPEPAGGNHKAINAAAKLFIIANALNGVWKPNWDNWDEYKYYPWFDMRSEAAGGSGFSYYGYYFGRSSSRVGSRLAFKDQETAEYAGRQFLDIYRDMMVID